MARLSTRHDPRAHRSGRLSALIGLVVVAAIVGLLLLSQQRAAPPTGAPGTPTAEGLNYQPLPEALKTAALQDARTRQTFRLADFNGKVVVLELMAIWCPLCVDQGDQIAAVVQQIGPGVVFVSVDVDPNEDAVVLGRYASRLDRNWTFAFDEAGAFNAALVRNVQTEIPETPVYIISPDGAGIFMTRPGIKSASEIRQLLDQALA